MLPRQTNRTEILGAEIGSESVMVFLVVPLLVRDDEVGGEEVVVNSGGWRLYYGVTINYIVHN
jgi:hypothetical protein